MNGPVGGINFTFGGKPPVPPTASCSASPTEVFPGDPVNATIRAQYFNPKHTLTYKWNSTGAKVSGSGTTANVDTTGLQPGSYTVSGYGHRSQREEEQRCFVQRRIYREGAAELSAYGELLGQSECDCHQPERDRQHHCQQPREPAA